MIFYFLINLPLGEQDSVTCLISLSAKSREALTSRRTSSVSLSSPKALEQPLNTSEHLAATESHQTGAEIRGNSHPVVTSGVQ